MAQVPTELRLVPASLPAAGPAAPAARGVATDERPAQALEPAAAPAAGAHAVLEFEPDEETILARLLPQNLAVQILRAQLESAAGFFGSQMAAMDGATRNAGDMIRLLTLNYNRARQANITRELIEIISGAETV
jgi:F-type H+-transporting ATPase subunit gamma